MPGEIEERPGGNRFAFIRQAAARRPRNDNSSESLHSVTFPSIHTFDMRVFQRYFLNHSIAAPAAFDPASLPRPCAGAFVEAAVIRFPDDWLGRYWPLTRRLR